MYKTFVHALAAFLSSPDHDQTASSRFPDLASFRLTLRTSAADALSERPDNAPFDELARALTLSSFPHLSHLSVVVEAERTERTMSLHDALGQLSLEELDGAQWGAYVLMIEEAFSRTLETASNMDVSVRLDRCSS